MLLKSKAVVVLKKQQSSLAQKCKYRKGKLGVWRNLVNKGRTGN